MGNKHPAGLGQPTQECWPEAWSTNEPIFRRVWTGETVTFEDKHFSLSRNGALEDGWFTASYAPIGDEAGSVAGIFVTVFETTKQHLAEKALRESEEQLRNLIDNLPDSAVYRYVRDANGNASFDYISAGIEHSNGVKPEEVLRDASALQSQILHEYLPKFIEAERVSARDLSVFQMEVPIRRPDGELRWIRLQSRPKRTANGVTWYGVQTDITERKSIEAALRESEERERAKRHELETILSAIPAVVFIAEDAACARVSSNPAGRRLLRLPEGANASKSAPEHEAPANFEIFSADGKLLKPEELPVQRAAASGRPIDAAEFEVRFTDGGRKHLFGNALPLFSSRGEVRGAVGAFLNITDRKRAEEALRESEERYKGLVEQTADGIFLATPEGRFADVNPAGCEMLGMTREEVLASTFHDVLDPADHSRLPAQLETLADGQVQLSEWRIRRKDGTVFPGEVSGRRLPNGYYQGVLRDITRRNKAEERTQLLLREVNHRSKNMLSLVLAIARQTVASNHEDFLDRFSDRIQALAASQDLLVKSQWSGVQLHDLVRSQLAHFEDLYGGRIAVIGPPLLVCVSAAQPIGMTLHELATNAGKYGALSDDRGCVKITWRIGRPKGGEAAFIMSWCERNGPPAKAPSRQGFGSYVISEMIEWSLDASVTLDFDVKGVTWRLRCPACSVVDEYQPFALDAKSVLATTARSVPAAAKPRILIVEDEAIVAAETALVLEQAGFGIVGPAASVAQAARLLRARGCDAAVLDINLGKETSEAVAAELARCGTPFVALSGYSPAQHPPAFRGAAVLTKPVRPEALVAEVRRCTAAACQGPAQPVTKHPVANFRRG
jgi:PAS domain S-box-containing protein